MTKHLATTTLLAAGLALAATMPMAATTPFEQLDEVGPVQTNTLVQTPKLFGDNARVTNFDTTALERIFGRTDKAIATETPMGMPTDKRKDGKTKVGTEYLALNPATPPFTFKQAKTNVDDMTVKAVAMRATAIKGHAIRHTGQTGGPLFAA